MKTIAALNVIPLGTSMLTKLHRHEEDWWACTRCKIGERANHHVFGRGDLPCDILFIGEAPGVDEDSCGLPFVGDSGRLLDKWIVAAEAAYNAAVGRHFSYAITNLVLCRPCDRQGGPNRVPDSDEIFNCQPRLQEFIALADPAAVVYVGRIAAQYGYLVPPTIPRLNVTHPAAYLRSGGSSSLLARDAEHALVDFVVTVRPNGDRH